MTIQPPVHLISTYQWYLTSCCFKFLPIAGTLQAGGGVMVVSFGVVVGGPGVMVVSFGVVVGGSGGGVVTPSEVVVVVVVVVVMLGPIVPFSEYSSF